MASVLHKQTKQFIPSVNTPDYMDGSWIINPDMDVVSGLPPKYWIIEGSILRAATDAEKAAIDKNQSYEGMSIDDIKAKINNDINMYRDAYIDGGVRFQNYMFDSDERARENILGMCNALALGVSIPASFTWRSKNNDDVPMDGTSLSQFGVGLLTFVSACFTTSWKHKDFLKDMETTNPDDIISYDYTVQWPTNIIEDMVFARS